MNKVTCGCGRGKVSAYDGKCGNCRTKKEQKALDQKFYLEAKAEREARNVNDPNHRP